MLCTISLKIPPPTKPHRIVSASGAWRIYAALILRGGTEATTVNVLQGLTLCATD